MNDYRADNGLGMLTATRSLNIASYNHSLDMSQNNYFSHTSQNGDSPWDRMAAAGYDDNTNKGENIAAGYPSAQAVFDGWRNSPEHNANMLNPNFDAIGIGHVDGGHYWTTDFGGVVDAPPSC
ncbi:MAG: CAP domain-containing protein [Thermomicrobiales bacterium]